MKTIKTLKDGDTLSKTELIALAEGREMRLVTGDLENEVVVEGDIFEDDVFTVSFNYGNPIYFMTTLADGEKAAVIIEGITTDPTSDGYVAVAQ